MLVETLNRGPRLRITFLCWWDVKPSSLTHSLLLVSNRPHGCFTCPMYTGCFIISVLILISCSLCQHQYTNYFKKYLRNKQNKFLFDISFGCLTFKISAPLGVNLITWYSTWRPFLAKVALIFEIILYTCSFRKFHKLTNSDETDTVNVLKIKQNNSHLF